MFTRAKIVGGGTYLKNHLTANDYYSEKERVAGYWYGQGASALGLDGEVTAAQFEALRKNLRPESGERLTPRTKDTRMPSLREAEKAFRLEHGRAGSASEVANFRLAMKPVSNRVAFYDYECSAQKSVSIMAILGGDERLVEAHQRAAKKGFAELERLASRQKNSIVRRDWEMTGNLCAAAFTHDASRALDPQLHTHFVIANATRSPSGRWYALEECHMYKAVRYAGKAYQNELAREVKALGYEIREARDEEGQVTGFEIEGVSNELCQRFSKRRKEIEREIKKFEKKHGRTPDSAEIARISRETRDAKLTEITTAEVRAKQLAQLSPGEREGLRELRGKAVERVELGQKVETAGREKEAVEAAIAHLYERQSVAMEHEILAESLNQKLGAVELEALRQAVAKENQLVCLAAREDNPLLSESATRQGLGLELWSISFVEETQYRFPSLNRDFVPADFLSTEQREAVRAILSMRDQVYGFRGLAGAGKTQTLEEVQRGLAQAGHRSFYMAPTADAAEQLRSKGFANATTVEDFLQNVSQRDNLKGTVVICDEAGLQSNRKGATLLHLAEQHDMRVLLVGDTRQHTSVEAGDFLRILETYSRLHRSEVKEIWRQKDAPEYRAAIEKMAAGHARGGLAALDALGWIHESGADYLERAADDYLRLTKGGADLEEVLVVSPTWAENHRLTEAIRSRLKAQHCLAANGVEVRVHDSYQWTEQQKRNPANYQAGQSIVFNRPFENWKAGDLAEVRSVADGGVTVVTNGTEASLPLKAPDRFDVGRSRLIEVTPGDKVLIRANQKRIGLINGQVLTVDQVAANGSVITREGLRIPAGFRQWCHGYVVTSHKSQGRTHKHVIVAGNRLDAKSAYVACSRGKHSCAVHTPDKAWLMQHLPEGTRRAALDVLSESVGHSPAVAAIKAGQQIGQQPKRRWSERIKRRIMKMIQIVQRHHFIAERRLLAPEIAAEQTQTQSHHQTPHTQTQRRSVRMRI